MVNQEVIASWEWKKRARPGNMRRREKHARLYIGPAFFQLVLSDRTIHFAKPKMDRREGEFPKFSPQLGKIITMHRPKENISNGLG